MALPITVAALVAGSTQATAAPLAAGAVIPMSASTSASGPVTHPEQDSMGSTIRAHEKVAATGTTSSAGTGAHMMLATSGSPKGMDVSSFQGNVDWTTAYRNGARFAYIKATEATGYQNPYMFSQFVGSYNAGLVRGTYHFMLPDRSSGATQATYFASHGGVWSADGKTLPPMLDAEYNPYGATCYGLSATAMVNWIADFSNTLYAETGRYPMIYTTTDWWRTCTGNSPRFGTTSPLFIANYSSYPGTMPNGWGYHTLWQYSDRGIFPGDQDVFNGSAAQLTALATGGRTASTTPPPTPTPPPRPTPPPTSPITLRWEGLGGASSWLGSALDAIHGVNGGQAQTFQHATVYYSPATGTREVHGAILAKYASVAGPAGFLRLPMTDESVSPDWTGRYNHFAGGGSIYWSPATGAHTVRGDIRARWASLGWELSRLGYPTTDEYSVIGGRRSTFQHGSITWNASTRATTVTYR